MLASVYIESSIISCAHPKNLEESTVLDDPIVEGVRKIGEAFAARYNNDLAAICKALKDKERQSGRKVVNRAPRRLVPETES